jgi:tRNA dimethylallyltransferase
MNKHLIVIAGPTAVGKTALSIELARHFDTEVVSADARQFFREMSIGTAKPTADEMEGVVHHFIDSHSISENYSVGQYERDALAALEDIFSRRDYAILTGGSGLYIKVVTEGMDEIPDVDPVIRENLQEQYDKEGLEPLLTELRKLDPAYYEVVDKANSQRVMRGLEVCLGTGMPFSTFRNQSSVARPFNIIKVALNMPRELLYERIDRRMDLMLDAGLLEEARSLLPFRHLNALQTVGYREIYDFLDGSYDWEEAMRLLKRNSRRYAKRQLTWFNKDKQYKWFEPRQFDEVVNYIEQQTKPGAAD